MVLAIALAAVAVLAAVVVLATGRGGELAEAHPDHPPLSLPPTHVITGTDVALLRLPTGLWGYNSAMTDEVLRLFAHTLSERDTRIAILEQQLAELRAKQEAGEEPIRWNVEREPQNPWEPPADPPSWSARDLIAESEPYDPYRERRRHADDEVPVDDVEQDR